jgi:hypothetical protein
MNTAPYMLRPVRFASWYNSVFACPAVTFDPEEGIFHMADQIKADQIKPNLPKEDEKENNGSMQSSHTLAQSTDCAVTKTNFVDVTAMIRSLQRTEGYTDCFRRGIADCGKLECSWRLYCLGVCEGNESDNFSR